MGDPALRLWTDTPKLIYADFDEQVSFGTNFIDVYVEDSDGVDVIDAEITLLKDDEIFITKSDLLSPHFSRISEIITHNSASACKLLVPTK